MNYTARREHLQIIRSISALLGPSYDPLLQISPVLSIKAGRMDTALLGELVTHSDFVKLLADIQIKIPTCTWGIEMPGFSGIDLYI